MPKLQDIDLTPLIGAILIIIGAPYGIFHIIFIEKSIDFFVVYCLFIPFLVISWLLSIYGVLASNFYALPIEDTPFLAGLIRNITSFFTYIMILPMFIVAFLTLFKFFINEDSSYADTDWVNYEPEKTSDQIREEQQRQWIDNASRLHNLSDYERHDLERRISPQ